MCQGGGSTHKNFTHYRKQQIEEGEHFTFRLCNNPKPVAPPLYTWLVIFTDLYISKDSIEIYKNTDNGSIW